MLFKLGLQKKNLETFNKYLLNINEEFKDAIKSKQEAILSVSHEVRNPLNVISGSTELALMDNSIVGTKHHLDNIKSNVLLILNLVNSVLDTSKMQNHDLEIIRVTINSMEFLDKVWNVGKILTSKKRLS